MLIDSLAIIGLSCSLDLKRSGTELAIKKTDGSWDRAADKIKTLLNFAGSGHLVFRCTSALEREELRSKRSGKKSIQSNRSTQNIELLLHMVISVNQLSIYGAVSDMIEELPVGVSDMVKELPVGQRAVEKPKALGQLDKLEIIAQPLLASWSVHRSLMCQCRRVWEVGLTGTSATADRRTN